MVNTSNSEYVFAPIKRDKVFKIVAAGEGKKSLMIDLLNCLIPELNVHDIHYDDKEDPGLSVYDKSCIFDALCTTEKNKQCIIEVQAYDIDTYPDRMINYAASLVKRQMEAKKAAISELPPEEREKARNDYELCPIYVVSILTGKLEHKKENGLDEGLISRYSVRNDLNGETMNDTLHFVYLETEYLRVGKMNPEECKGLVEKLAWSVKYMQEVKTRPESFNEEMMVKLYRNSEIANMTERQQELVYKEFDEDLRRSAELATAERKGRVEERALFHAETIEMVKSMLSDGMSVELVSKYSGLSVEEVLALK